MLTTKIVLAVSALGLATTLADPQPAFNSMLKRDDQSIKPAPMLFKRQFGGTEDFPEKCQSKCKGYQDLVEECTGTPDAPVQATQDEMIQCACEGDLVSLVKPCMECTPETFESGSSGVDIDAMITVFEAGCKVSSGSAGGITDASAPKDDDAGSESDGEDGDGGKVDPSDTIASGSKTAGGSSASPSGSGAADGKGAGFMIQPRYISAALVGAVVGAVAFA